MSVNNPAPRVKPEFIVERNGRQFVLVNGLLDLAHQDGLSLLATDMIIPGTEVNGVPTWLFKATVTTSKGTFTGYGDATPENVSRAMLTVLPRFAETRSIARALRFATNVAVVAFEEMGPEDPNDAHSPIARQPDPSVQSSVRNDPVPVASDVRNETRPGVTRGAAPPPASNLATPAQVRAIYAIGAAGHLSEGEVDAHAVAFSDGMKPIEMSRKVASDFITRLKDPKPLPPLDDDETPF